MQCELVDRKSTLHAKAIKKTNRDVAWGHHDRATMCNSSRRRF